MDLNKKNMKRIALLIAFGLLLYWGLNHPGQAGQMLSTVFSIFLPFLLGGCLAFLLNVILRPVERGWRRAWGKRYGPRQKRAQRPVCLLVSTLLLVGVVFAIFFIVVPALKDSVVNFVSLLPSRLTHLEHWWNNLAGFLEAHSIQLPEFSLNSAELQNNITSFLSKYGEDFLNTTIGITSSIFSLVVNLVLALAFSLYLLAQKETLTGQAKKVVRALFSEKWAHWIDHLPPFCSFPPPLPIRYSYHIFSLLPLRPISSLSLIPTRLLSNSPKAQCFLRIFHDKIVKTPGKFWTSPLALLYKMFQNHPKKPPEFLEQEKF